MWDVVDKNNRYVTTYIHGADIRYIKSLQLASEGTMESSSFRAELDSHADTCVAGSGFLKVEETTRTVTVSGYDEQSGHQKAIPVVSAATVWYEPLSKKEYCLVFHEALWFGDNLTQSLLNPTQMRRNGLIVDDVARQDDPESTHSIFVTDANLRISLTLRGVMSGFTIRLPTMDEYTSLPQIIMTSDSPWEPHSRSHEETEALVSGSEYQPYTDYDPHDLDNNHRLLKALESKQCEGSGTDYPEFMSDDMIYKRLIAQVVSAPDDVPGDGLSGHDHSSVYTQYIEIREISKLTSSERMSILTPEILAKKWNIGLATAKRTMHVTTQAGLRNVFMPGERRLRQRTNHLRFPTLSGKYYTDTMFASKKSARMFKTAQIFTNGKGFDFFYPMVDKTSVEVARTLHQFIANVGIPQDLISDNALELTEGEVRKVCNQYHINRKTAPPYSPWRNAAEASVRELKTMTRRLMRHRNVPKRLWCYAGQHAAALRRHCALDIPSLEGRTPIEAVTGSTPDITSYCLFEFYEPVRTVEPDQQFPEHRMAFGYFLGIYESCTDPLSFLILQKSGKVLIRKSVHGLTEDELKDPRVMDGLKELNDAIQRKFGDKIKDTDIDPDVHAALQAESEIAEDDPFDDEADKNNPNLLPTVETAVDPVTHTPDTYDEYIAASILLPQGGEQKMAKVLRRRHDTKSRLPIGTRNANPILDSRQYEVEFPDGTTDIFTANLIAENLYPQIDNEGRTHQVMREQLSSAGGLMEYTGEHFGKQLRGNLLHTKYKSSRRHTVFFTPVTVAGSTVFTFEQRKFYIHGF
jgi:hypothetical protein